MTLTPNIETPLVDKATQKSLFKANQQRAGSSDFWRKINWTEEEKAKALAPADEARDMILRTTETKKGYQWPLYTKLKRQRRASEKLTKKTEELDVATLQHQFRGKLEAAEKQKNQWETGNSSGDKAISFLGDLIEFAGEFSGIIEIMQGLDQGYGGAGYAALSSLLAVAVNTKRKDEIFVDAVLDLRNEYSRMVTISDIYATPEMISYITTAYKLGIQFVHDAERNFARSFWRRLMDTILRPPFLIKRKVKEISNAMAQIEKERDTLLNKRLHEVQAEIGKVGSDLKDLSRDVHKVKTGVIGLRANVEKQRLALLNSELYRYHIQPDQTVTEYAAHLSSAFDRPPGLTRFSFEALVREKAYDSWRKNRHHCMLVLYGRTMADQTSFCWLSPASIELASAIRQEARHAAGTRMAVADLYCQKKDLMTGTITQVSAIVCLLLQLLEEDSTMLQDASTFESLRARINKAKSDGDRMCELLREVMETFDVVYILIDRVDRISGNFMRELLKSAMLRCTKVTVKALCVSSRSEDIATKVVDLSEDVDEKNIISLQIDQSQQGQ